MTKYPPDTLGLSESEMREFAQLVVEEVLRHWTTRDDQPVIQTGTPDQLLTELGGQLPDAPFDMRDSLELLTRVALQHQQHGDHPRYFARVPGPSSFAAVLGEWLATGFNTIAASWTGGSGPTALELVVIRWLSAFLGLPDDTEGILVSGGSLANFTAFGAARASQRSGIVYLTDQAHSSITRGLLALGLSPSDLRLIPTEETLRMVPSLLEQRITSDIQNKLTPFMVIASCGTTNTGAIDPLGEIADICERYNLWFHVDGAYGAPAIAVRDDPEIQKGLFRADSIAVDPHKWLFQPYDCGCVLVTRPGALQNAYNMQAEYLKDVEAGRGEVDMRSRSLELTRRSRATKLWLTFRTYGASRIRQAIRHSVKLAEYAEEYLRSDPQTWDVVTPAQIGIVTFAFNGADKSRHELIARQITESGFAALTTTQILHRSVLRMCIINPLTREEDLRRTIDLLKQYGATINTN